MKRLFAVLLAGAAMFAATHASAQERPTIVLVHGAFADASGWNSVAEILEADGYHTIAAANPLRGITTDARNIAALVDSIEGPVLLVGHSYGGAIISAAAPGHENVTGLVYVGAFAPDEDETIGGLLEQFPGAILAQALNPPVPLENGDADLYIGRAGFHAAFAADVTEAQAALMAITQRPIVASAFGEPFAGEPAWKTLPSYFVYGAEDKAIPANLLAFMAERAGSLHTVVIEGASHVPMMSQPQAVAEVILEAAEAAR